MNDHYFVSCQDNGKTALLLGPFTNKENCENFAYGDMRSAVVDACCAIDPKSWFYSFGMVKMSESKTYTGVLNKANPEKWNGVLS